MISEQEALEIIRWGKTQGYNKQQCLSIVNRRDHELRVIAEKARIKKERDKLRREWEEKEQQRIDIQRETVNLTSALDEKVIGTNKHGQQYLYKDFEKKDGEWHHKTMGSVKDNFADHYLENLQKTGSSIIAEMGKDILGKNIDYRPILNEETKNQSGII